MSLQNTGSQNVENAAPALPFSLQIDPAAVNQMVSNAIIQSAIGAELKKAIDDAVNKTLKPDSWGRSPIADVVQAHIRNQIMELVSEEFKGTIREKVKQAITDQLTDKMIEEMVTKFWNNR